MDKKKIIIIGDRSPNFKEILNKFKGDAVTVNDPPELTTNKLQELNIPTPNRAERRKRRRQKWGNIK